MARGIFPVRVSQDRAYLHLDYQQARLLPQP
jgi:hypothetical protein